MSECAVRKGLLAVAAIAIGGISFWFLQSPLVAPDERAAAPAATPAPAVVPAKVPIPYSEARPILEAHRDRLPAALKGKTASEQESAWPAWAAAHDAAIRARLAQGDEDSVVNLWLYGTTFTTLPRATEQEIASLASRADAEDLLLRRLDDLVAGIASPGDERTAPVRAPARRAPGDRSGDRGRPGAGADLPGQGQGARHRGARALPARRGIGAAAGQPGERADRVLDDLQRPGAVDGHEVDRRLRARQGARSDRREGDAPPQSVRRVAIVGPGLDFTDKAEGFDFYPQQTIQPFALRRHARPVRPGAARCDPRDDAGSESAGQRASGGGPRSAPSAASRTCCSCR